ncbi:MAG: serine/threonine-protein kinase [Myxococcota bacterium]
MHAGPYELLERIGTGGMAEVFRARQGSGPFARTVAVKRILPRLAGDAEHVAMFIDEARIAAQLAHPNIAQVFDFGRDGDAHYIAMEHVHGRDMAAVLQRHRLRGTLLPLDLVAHLGLRIADALQHAHDACSARGRPLGIVHRDLSPHNVLVGFEGAVKVIDFGLARAAGRLVSTEVGIVKGKLAYLSPEQARGQRVDARSDLFSLGACLYEWITGTRLFDRASDVGTLTAVSRAVVPPPRALRPELPVSLQQVVLRALARDPRDRFASAFDLSETLRDVARAEGFRAGRREVAEHLRRLFPESRPPTSAELRDAVELLDSVDDLSGPRTEPDTRFEDVTVVAR